MTTINTQHRAGARVARYATFCLFALLAVLCLSSQTHAQWTTTGTNTTTTSNVGIGTASPVSPLEIQAPDAPITLSQAGVAAKSTIQSAVGIDLHMSANAKWSSSVWNRYDTSRPSWNIMLAPSVGADFVGIRRAAPGVGNIVWTDFLRITNTGNVGIGTSAPTYLLDVMGSTAFRVRDSTGREYLSTATRTGTSSTSPTVSLAGARLIVDNDGPEGGNSTVLRRAVNSIIINPSEHPTFPGGLIVRQVGGGYGLVVNQSTNGNVGIGTGAPQSKLHVAGDIRVDGNISAKYQDVAEWVPSAQKLSAGTVVILDEERSNQVLASVSSYDTKVAGVVSAQPGIALGEAGEGKVLVATTGRVKVKVDATRAPVRIGDLLVTSDLPGVAMKSEPIVLRGRRIHEPGTIIGKALESLDKGTGEILVLLSLQ
jgi:hypothetical protein